KPDADVAAQRARSGLVEPVGPAAIIIETQMVRVGQAGNDQVLMAEYLRSVELPIEVVEDASLDVRRRRNQAVSVEDCAQTVWRHPEIVHRAQELDFLVTRFGDVDESSFQVPSRIVTQRVELNPDFFQSTRARRCAASGRRAADLRSYCCDSDSREKFAPIHL